MRPSRSVVVVVVAAAVLALVPGLLGCSANGRGVRPPVPPSDGGGGGGVDAGRVASDAGASGADAGARADAGAGVDAGVTPRADAGPGGFDAGASAVDAGPPRVDAGAGGVVAPTAAGQVVISELMQNPALLTDALGEWLELYNPSATTSYDLNGCVLSDLGTDSHAIAAPLVIGPHAYVTLARSATPGFTPTYVYAAFNLANTADEVLLTCSGVLIDEVDYDTAAGWTVPTGGSLQLSPSSLDAVSNDAPTAWCPATVAFGSGDLGTPGAANGC